MCMIIKKTECLKKGIYVYVVRYIYRKQICSPFRTHTIWEMKKTYTVDEGNTKIKGRLRKKPLDQGAFHCFYTLEAADRFIDILCDNNRPGTYQIHKAWIPSGTYVAHGSIVRAYMSGGRQCLGTRRLMLSKKVSERVVEKRTYASYQYLTSADTSYKTFTHTGYAYNTGSTT